MPNYNRVILAGHLTRDPQLSYLPSNTPVAEFGLAVNRRWRGQDNQQREETCFVDCRIYGRQSETFNQYMSKGSPVLIEGRLQLDQWEGKDGSRRSKHRIIVERFQFLGSQQGKHEPEEQKPPQKPEPSKPEPPKPDNPNIPF